jgi:hypothetical protein
MTTTYLRFAKPFLLPAACIGSFPALILNAIRTRTTGLGYSKPNRFQSGGDWDSAHVTGLATGALGVKQQIKPR